MFFDISTVTVFFVRLLDGHNFVLRAIWINEDVLGLQW